MYITKVKYDRTVIPVMPRNDEYCEPDILYVYIDTGEYFPIIVNAWRLKFIDMKKAFYRAITDVEYKYGECYNLKEAGEMYLKEAARQQALRDLKMYISDKMKNMIYKFRKFFKNDRRRKSWDLLEGDRTMGNSCTSDDGDGGNWRVVGCSWKI